MKYQKYLLTVPVSIVTSYLFNCYCFGSFDPNTFPVEMKVGQCFGVLIVLCIAFTVKEDNKEGEKLNKKLDS